MMSATKHILWVAAALGVMVVVACYNERKPPLTPDGPEMTTPVGSDSGLETPPPAPTTSAK
jgi:hypothetical protein